MFLLLKCPQAMQCHYATLLSFPVWRILIYAVLFYDYIVILKLANQ